jgi:hypothetical protein
MMLDAEVFLGSRVLQPLLEELYILIKEIQGSDFSFEDLSKRIAHFQNFFRSYNDMKIGEGLIDEVFRNLIKIEVSPSKLSPLAFSGPGSRLTYTSHAHGSYHILTFGGKSMTKESWQGCLDEILMKVCDIGRTLAEQLYERFPHTDLLDALSVLQASYWEKPQLLNLEDSVEVLVGFYGTEKLQMVGSSKNITVPPIINGDLYRTQTKQFKEIMCDRVPSILKAITKRRAEDQPRKDQARKARSHVEDESSLDDAVEEEVEVKSLTQYVWAYLSKAREGRDVSEFVKLAVIMLIIPVSSVQAERLFSCMNFVKNDRRNRLGENHLNDCVRLFMSAYDMKAFPYEKALDYFLNAKERRGVTAGRSAMKRSHNAAFVDESVMDAIF